ncbi:WD40/YVTN/BNR-like repeat-containing protein [Sandarakinorhabdus sp. DWP1-3-1]|uniref:WD40/YVTN/BNR-like repeat-containing protein n=1 Tax=Sandarakinorhabdus sp. DWP1-3-1 TaxID=2804627 RepID=UPI003CEC1B6C
MNVRVLALACSILLSGIALAKAPSGAVPAPAASEDPFFGGLEWRNIGPNRGGRSISAVGSDARPNEYYFAATGGGLWKTTDAGTSWSATTDGKIPTGAVGGVAVCEANPDIVYLTTGETQLRGNVLPGRGVYKTIDAGKTWQDIGLKDVQNFSRVRIHPKDCNTVYVGGFGHYGAENPERGVFKTVDGGKSWKKTLYRDPRSGAVDIVIDPSIPETIYAALWEAWRKPWGMSSGGPGSGLFKSVDGGANWTELTRAPGMPAKGLIGKIGVTVSPVDPRRLYALVEHEDGGLFVSDDAGASWKRTNDNRDLRQRAFYYTRLVADTKVKDRVYVLNVDFWRSDDGGKTFPTKIKVPHGDNHDLWISRTDNQRMIQANDGGANVSVNGGKSWTGQAYPTAQIYRLALTNHKPWFACGGQQDNSTICVPSRGWKHMNALGGQYGFAAGGGESGYVANDPRNPNIFYAGSYGGMLTRFDYATGQRRAINVLPDNPMGASAADIAERFQWTYPIVFDPQDAGTLYVTSQHVWRSRDEGQSWDRISPDLTRHDPATLGPSGGPITRDQTGVETYATVFALAPSRLEKDVIWAASDDGLVHVTRDDGGNWTNVTPADLPANLKITTVEPSPHRPGTAYMTGHRFLLDDFRPYVLRTTDYGRTWTSIAGNIPADEMARSIREDVVKPGLLYLGTERGVWLSFDNGGKWQRLQRNLPDVQVSDLAVTDEDLVIATHGRSFWVMEKIGVLRQLDPAGRQARQVRLFKPSPAIRELDKGVAIDYFLPRTPRKLSLEIIDPAGKLIHSFAGTLAPPEPKSDKTAADAPAPATGVSESAVAAGSDAVVGNTAEKTAITPAKPKTPPRPAMKAGMNRFTWDMRWPGFTRVDKMVLWTSRNRGVLAMPGTYTARLVVDGATQSETFELRLDPRLASARPEDLKARFDLATAASAKVSQANQAVLLARGLRAQTDARLQAKPQPAVAEAIRTFQSRVDAIESEIYQVNNRSRQDPLNYPIRLNDKLAGIIDHVERGETAPTAQTRTTFADLSARLDRQTAALDAVLATDLPPLNATLTRAGLKPIVRQSEPPGAEVVDDDDDDAEKGKSER